MIKTALVLLLSAAPLLAQTQRHAALGDRVRIRAPKAGYGRLTGEVTATTPDALQIRLNGGTEVAVMRAQIDEMLLSLSSRRNTVRGAAVGTLLAGAVAFLYGPKKVSPGQPPSARGSVVMSNVIAAAIGGATIGALAGHYTRSDTWIKLSPGP
jgi:hypothetical protein